MEELDIALIGAGLIARVHLGAWLSAGARVRIYSTDGQAAALAEEFGVTAVGSLQDAISGASAVDICTPTDTHREIALAAIAAGVDVVSEKPLAHNAAAAEEMADAAERSGVRLYPCHTMRFRPAYSRLHDLTAQGSLGRAAHARFTMRSFHPRAWSAPATVRSGGILTDPMIHMADIARWVFGDVVKVHARYQGHIAAPAPAGATAMGTAVLTHAEGGITQIVTGWAPPRTPLHATFSVSGTAGSIEYDSRKDPALRPTGSMSDNPLYVGESPFIAEMQEFATAFRGGPEPRVSAADGVAAVRIAEAAAESAWTGRAIDMNPTAATASREGTGQ